MRRGLPTPVFTCAARAPYTALNLASEFLRQLPDTSTARKSPLR